MYGQCLTQLASVSAAQDLSHHELACPYRQPQFIYFVIRVLMNFVLGRDADIGQQISKPSCSPKGKVHFVLQTRTQRHLKTLVIWLFDSSLDIFECYMCCLNFFLCPWNVFPKTWSATSMQLQSFFFWVLKGGESKSEKRWEFGVWSLLKFIKDLSISILKIDKNRYFC